MTEIPNILRDHIASGQVVLFLGAGASIGALHPHHKNNPPIGAKLANHIADKFLTPDYANAPLAQVAELAISETDLFTVQEFIADIYKDYQPSDFHKVIPKFSWKAIVTTNYDLIIERAYSSAENTLQRLITFKKNGERIENKVSGSSDALYLKLHGCVTNINDRDLPLILTVDQYVTHRKNRSRLFERLADLARECPFLYIGYSLADSNIRQIMIELSELGDAKPRSYLVSPTITPQENRFWEGRKVTSIQLTFEDFINRINAEIPFYFRALSTAKKQDEHPILARSANIHMRPSDSLMSFLNRDSDYIYKGFKTGNTDPKAFYKGYFQNWDPIEMKLDVRRSVTDKILSEVFLMSEDEKREKQELIVLKGHAGSGKSVLLKRIAWDAAIEFNKLCLVTKQSSTPEYEPLNELYSLCKERIFFFIDSATDDIELIESFLLKAGKDKLPLTIITTSRENEWRVSCEDTLDPYVTNSYNVQYLEQRAIEDLIRLLEKHRSLGHLAGLTFEEQKEALSLKSGRQLLVALHEATLGKPFRDIVFDEYQSIPSRQAQELYLTVCVLHRLGVPTRAGVISRVHGVPFTYFEERLFKPLEFIVFAKRNQIIQDYEYRTRHSTIAELVFERVLVNQDDRLNEYAKILNTLDVDYSSDRTAFVGMTNAKHLKELFTTSQAREIYRIANGRSSKDAALLQQEAIFEMNSNDGDLDKATNLLSEARKLAPWNRSIAHSLAELSLKKSEKAISPIEKDKLRQESRKIAHEISSKTDISAHSVHTLIKISLSELEDALSGGEDLGQVERITNELEKTLSSALQAFPNESFLLDADAKFSILIDKHPRALESLEKAFQKNKRSSYIAMRLANLYCQSKQITNAINVLKQALDSTPNDKELNFKLAMILQRSDDPNINEIKHHLRNSFTRSDSRYEAQYQYAKLLYLENSLDMASEIFAEISNAPVDIRIRRKPRDVVLKSGSPQRYSGTLINIEASFGFIKRDGFGDNIYASVYHDHKYNWDKLFRGKRVTFQMAFNYYGPVALSINEE